MQYEKNYLTQVLFQLAYNNIESLKNSIDDSLITLCQEITGGQIVEQKNTNITFTGGAAAFQQKIVSSWLFKGERLQIRVQNEFLQIIDLKYTTHQEYHPNIIKIVNLLKDTYKPIITKVTLKYTNVITDEQGSPFDFSDKIDSSLLVATAKYEEEGLRRSMGAITMKDNEDIETNITYGFFNSQFPNKISKKEFMLDFDSSIIVSENNTDTVDSQILKLRNKINSLFEKSIANELRTKMVII